MIAMSACTASATVNGSAGPGTGTVATCSRDSSVVGCVGAAAGYSCSGTESPDETDDSPHLQRGDGSNAGLTLYCCVETTTVTTGCTADSSIVGCTGASIGFSCTGSAEPGQGDSSLVCSAGTPSGRRPSTAAPATRHRQARAQRTRPSRGAPVPPSASRARAPIVPRRSTRRSTAAPACRAAPARVLLRHCRQRDADADDHVRRRRGGVLARRPRPGYSCTGGIAPTQSDTTLSCGQGTPEADGTTLALLLQRRGARCHVHGRPIRHGLSRRFDGIHLFRRRQPDDLVAPLRDGHGRGQRSHELLLHDNELKVRESSRGRGRACRSRPRIAIAIYADGRSL